MAHLKKKCTGRCSSFMMSLRKSSVSGDDAMKLLRSSMVFGRIVCIMVEAACTALSVGIYHMNNAVAAKVCRLDPCRSSTPAACAAGWHAGRSPVQSRRPPGCRIKGHADPGGRRHVVHVVEAADKCDRSTVACTQPSPCPVPDDAASPTSPHRAPCLRWPSRR